MNENKTVDKLIQAYKTKLPLYRSMQRYYDGEHDIKRNYPRKPNTINQIVIENYVAKFIQEEIGYVLGNPLSLVSMSGDRSIIKAVSDALYHWNDNHNQELMKALEIFGTAYILDYIDYKGRFSERILTPLNAALYCNMDGVPQIFIHFYKPTFENTEYRDVYYADGRIETYKGNTLVDTRKITFAEIPVSVCRLDNIKDTIYYKIKNLQDSYNHILSDQCNIISEYRRAYLVISGVKVDEDTERLLRENSIINLPSPANTNAKWLTKDMPDGYIENNLNRLKNAMYSVTNHIDGNEKLQSNTSGQALRNRLVFLEQRCNMICSVVVNTIYERIERLIHYLNIQGANYDYKDIKIVATPDIPQDVVSIIQALVQLGIGENISRETALSIIPFVENPLQEIEKIKAEKANNQKIELDKLDDYGGDDE